MNGYCIPRCRNQRITSFRGAYRNATCQNSRTDANFRDSVSMIKTCRKTSPRLVCCMGSIISLIDFGVKIVL